MRMSYPLGHYRTTGAIHIPLRIKNSVWSDIVTRHVESLTFAELDTTRTAGMKSNDAADKEHPEGVIWLDGLCTVLENGNVDEKLVAHYSRQEGPRGTDSNTASRFTMMTKALFRIGESPQRPTTGGILMDTPYHPKDLKKDRKYQV